MLSRRLLGSQGSNSSETNCDLKATVRGAWIQDSLPERARKPLPQAVDGENTHTNGLPSPKTTPRVQL